jgi:hypothetical protein
MSASANDIYLACGLCASVLSPNTQCDHAQYIRTEWDTQETEIVIVKKSILGDEKKAQTKVTHHVKNELKCRCGQVCLENVNSKCDLKNTYSGCNCEKTTFNFIDDRGQITAIVSCSQSTHKCEYQGITNILHWQQDKSTKHIMHPSGLQHTHMCFICKHGGKIRVPTYKPCEICLGMSGLKCTDCGGLGAKPDPGYKSSFTRCHCTKGYTELCWGCEGHLAVRSGEKVIDCTKCIKSKEAPNIRPIQKPIAERPPSPSDLSTKRPPSPSQMSQSQASTDKIKLHFETEQ